MEGWLASVKLYVSAGPRICLLTSVSEWEWSMHAKMQAHMCAHANKTASLQGSLPAVTYNTLKYSETSVQFWSGLLKTDMVSGMTASNCRHSLVKPQKHTHLHTCLWSLNNETELLLRSHYKILSCHQSDRTNLLRSITERGVCSILKRQKHTTLMTCGSTGCHLKTRAIIYPSYVCNNVCVHGYECVSNFFISTPYSQTEIWN